MLPMQDTINYYVCGKIAVLFPILSRWPCGETVIVLAAVPEFLCRETPTLAETFKKAL